MKPIAIILGTRPEIIKLSPIVAYCSENSIDYYLIHSNQHYSKELDLIFFKQLDIPPPHYSLEVGSGTHGEQTGKMLQRIEKIYFSQPTSFVIVQGDTNTTLAGALTAKKIPVPVGHVEAGLRSHDMKMPEEINRIITDHISDICFVPTSKQKEILLREGIDISRILITGNTIVDAVYRNLNFMKIDTLDELNLTKKGYILSTIHRAENVDDKYRLSEILTAIADVGMIYDLPVIAPFHPRTIKMIKQFQLKLSESIILINPQGYFEFLALLKYATLVMTDSGGIQEEACILRVPCVTIRNNTERPETVETGANVIAGVTKTKILSSVETMINRSPNWENPFGDGQSTEIIMKKILNTER